MDESRSNHSWIIGEGRVEHRVGLACSSHAVNEDCGIEPREHVGNRFQHGFLEYFQVGGFWFKYLLVVVESLCLSGKVGGNNLNLLLVHNGDRL